MSPLITVHSLGLMCVPGLVLCVQGLLAVSADPQAGRFIHRANRTLVDEVSCRLHKDALVGPMSQNKLETFASRSIKIPLPTGIRELAVGYPKFRGTRDTPGVRALSAQVNSTVHAGEAKIFVQDDFLRLDALLLSGITIHI